MNVWLYMHVCCDIAVVCIHVDMLFDQSTQQSGSRDVCRTMCEVLASLFGILPDRCETVSWCSFQVGDAVKMYLSQTCFSLWLNQFIYKQYNVMFCMSCSSFTLYCFALTMHIYVRYVIAFAWHTQHRTNASGLCKLFCQWKRIDVSKLHLHVLRVREGGCIAWQFALKLLKTERNSKKPEDHRLERELRTLRFQNHQLTMPTLLLGVFDLKLYRETPLEMGRFAFSKIGKTGRSSF